MLKRKTAQLAIAALLSVCGSVARAEEHPEALWLRYPAISPDGGRIAFSYAGQIWTVAALGGKASPLTGSPWHATHPVWSPDGQSIAFAADRHGQDDVFIAPAGGGAIARLTYHSANDRPMSFTPDGKEVVFSSARLGDPKADATNAVYGLSGLYQRPYAVSAMGGRPRQLLPTTALNLTYGPDGRILYEDDPSIVENTWRKHHVSDASHDIWLYDPNTNHHEEITGYRGEDRDPIWSADGSQVYWLSERGGNFNVWRKGLDQSEPEQVTFHERWPVRFLSSASDGTLAYAWNGALWRLDPDAAEPVRITVTISQGSLYDTTSIRDVTGEVTQMAIAPGGREIAFVARGEIFATGWDSKVTRRITDTVAQERDPAFSADGRRLVYASEGSGSWDIYETSMNDGDEVDRFSAPVALNERALVKDDADLFAPAYDPEGKRIAYLRNRTELRVQDLQTGTSLIAQAGDRTYSYNDGDLALEWSPDGQARDGHVVTRYPLARWTKPSILLQNAGSYSDGSVFPMLYKKKGVGKIVGDRTPGTGTAVSDVPQLQAGLRYRVPELGFQLNDGTWFENSEIEPDILIHNDPNLVAEGRDPQLEAAVKAMLEQLK
ncbi:Protein TolB [Symbiodinium microadriaticum]|uniref:Protein TolB n=1 Tax=Symbiodinium microadriaticum TaxID=2951 RepID=A0A1Q9BZK3_SYMMI|nr:Protein TolB [Symbiodinium microadriaticum]